MLVVGIIFLVLAAVLIIVGGLATLRKLPGNSVVGLRLAEIRKTGRHGTTPTLLRARSGSWEGSLSFSVVLSRFALKVGCG